MYVYIYRGYAVRIIGAPPPPLSVFSDSFLSLPSQELRKEIGFIVCIDRSTCIIIGQAHNRRNIESDLRFHDVWGRVNKVTSRHAKSEFISQLLRKFSNMRDIRNS